MFCRRRCRRLWGLGLRGLMMGWLGWWWEGGAMAKVRMVRRILAIGIVMEVVLLFKFIIISCLFIFRLFNIRILPIAIPQYYQTTSHQAPHLPNYTPPSSPHYSPLPLHPQFPTQHPSAPPLSPPFPPSPPSPPSPSSSLSSLNHPQNLLLKYFH